MNRYPTYKSSGIEWIGDIPDHWQLLPLKYCVGEKIADGPHETPEFVEDGVPFVSAEAVQNGRINLQSCRGYITKDLDERYSEKCKPQYEDVFVVKSGSTTGKVAYVDTHEDFNVWSPLALVRANKNSVPLFLYFALSSESFQTSVQQYWSFGTQPNIGMNVLENLRIGVPPKADQQCIASYLDQKTALIDETIRKKERLMELLQEERTAMINQAVTRGIDPTVRLRPSGVERLGDIPEHWIRSKVSYISLVVRGASPRPAGDPRYFNGTHTPWITVAEVTKDDEKFLTSVSEYLTAEGQLQSRLLPVDTLIMSNSGATLGVPKIIQLSGCINDGSVAFFNIRKVLKDFLYYFFVANTEEYRKMMKGSGQPNLNTDIVKMTPIAYPSISEQEQIVAYIERNIETLKGAARKIDQEIILLQEYRAALINDVVTGKVCVTG